MTKKPKPIVNPLQEALDAAGIDGVVEYAHWMPEHLKCQISGVYDYIQRQGRSDDELIALAVASFAQHLERAR